MPLDKKPGYQEGTKKDYDFDSIDIEKWKEIVTCLENTNPSAKAQVQTLKFLKELVEFAQENENVIPKDVLYNFELVMGKLKTYPFTNLDRVNNLLAGAGLKDYKLRARQPGNLPGGKAAQRFYGFVYSKPE
jgi:hypothetical protein